MAIGTAMFNEEKKYFSEPFGRVMFSSGSNLKKWKRAEIESLRGDLGAECGFGGCDSDSCVAPDGLIWIETPMPWASRIIFQIYQYKLCFLKLNKFPKAWRRLSAAALSCWSLQWSLRWSWWWLIWWWSRSRLEAPTQLVCWFWLLCWKYQSLTDWLTKWLQEKLAHLKLTSSPIFTHNIENGQNDYSHSIEPKSNQFTSATTFTFKQQPSMMSLWPLRMVYRWGIKDHPRINQSTLSHITIICTRVTSMKLKLLC